MTIAESEAILSRRPGIGTDSLRGLNKLILIKTQWYPELMMKLEMAAKQEARAWNLKDHQVEVITGPGALELPMLVQWVGESHPSDDLAVVALGCVVRGDTPHFDYVCSNAMTQLQAVSLKLSLAFGNGLLTVDSIEQARARESKGAEAVQAALWMYHLKTQLLGRVKGGHGISSSQS